MYGKKLKLIRNTLNLSQEQMAAKLNLAYRTYAAYERNENNPPYSMLVDILKNFDINLNWFIGDVGEMFITSSCGTQIDELFCRIKNIENVLNIK